MRGPLTPERLRRLDPSDMLQTTLLLPEQVLAGRSLPRPAIPGGRPDGVFVLGMGGSAIGGDLLGSILAERDGPPVTVVRDFRLPPGASRGSLVLAASYSGSTAETLSACRMAQSRGCTVVGISSGGPLRELVGGRRHILVPGGLRPRSALALLLLPMLGVLEDLGVGDFRRQSREAAGELSAMRGALGPGRTARTNTALSAARGLRGAFPVIMSGPFLAPAARRWTTQLNENAKVLASMETFPEIDHNGLVGWANDPAARRCSVVILRDSREDPRIGRRVALARRLGLSRARSVLEVRSRGRGALSRLLSAVFVGDLASVYLALLRGVDPAPVEVIDRMKRQLAGSGG